MQIEKKAEGKIWLITLLPEPSPELASGLLESLDKAQDDFPEMLLFDFEQVQIVNSAFIGIIVNLYKKLNERGSSIAIIRMKKFLRQIFEIADITSLVNFFDSYREAEGAVSGR
ncbi:MAG: STAS domain-containing protein [Fibrobacterota bacterium]